MGLYRDFISQTRKPEGFLGKMMVSGMNGGHAKLADWGMSHLEGISASNIAELGCGGGRNAGELLKKYPHRYIIESRTLESAVDSQARLRKLLGQ